MQSFSSVKKSKKIKTIKKHCFFSIADVMISVTLVGGVGDTESALRRRLRKESIKSQNGAAMRWAIGAGPNGFLELQLQSLPLPAASVNGKPLLREGSE